MYVQTCEEKMSSQLFGVLFFNFTSLYEDLLDQTTYVLVNIVKIVHTFNCLVGKEL